MSAQHQIRIEGELAACRCSKQPKHYHEPGRDLHFLECSPCGVRTGKFATFQEAVAQWEAQQIEAVPIPRRVA